VSGNAAGDLRRIYAARFAANAAYRRAVWRILIDDFFSQWLRPTDAVLDLGCGYGEFINQVRASRRLAMDLNPDAPARLEPAVECLLQDCSQPWAVPDGTLDVVFTSNFFEHLPDKAALGRTLDEVRRCLKPGGRLIALGPNVRYLPGAYWDFWDHHVALSDRSLAEALRTREFELDRVVPRFLPYTMADGRERPLILLRWYLRLPAAWPLFGRQFLVIARRPA
jgi:SAM-dependent methyltransferase